MFGQLIQNARGLCYERVAAAGYLQRAPRDWKEFLGGIFTSRMKAVGFNFRENITEACPPLNTYKAGEVLERWIQKTKALAKLKHCEMGGVLSVVDVFAAGFLPYASQLCLYWIEIYFYRTIN